MFWETCSHNSGLVAFLKKNKQKQSTDPKSGFTWMAIVKSSTVIGWSVK